MRRGPASSSRDCCWPRPGSTRHRVRHVGPPVPSAPHIAMTVRMLRAAGDDVAEHVFWAGRTKAGHPADALGGRPAGSPGRRHRRARPVQRRAVPGRGAGHRGRGDRRRLAAGQPAAGRGVLDCWRGWAAVRVGADASPSPAPAGARPRRRPARVGELAPVLTAVAAVAESPRSAPGWRTSAGTRPTGWPPWPARSTRSAATSPTARRAADRPRPLRAGQPRIVRELRRPPDGDRRRRARPGRPGIRVAARTPWPRPARTLWTSGPGCWDWKPEPVMSRQSGYARLDEDDVRVRPGRSPGRAPGGARRTPAPWRAS